MNNKKEMPSSSASPSASPSVEAQYLDIDLDQMQAKVNLGCGRRKIPGFINVDKNLSCEPDYIVDIEKDGLPHFEDNSVDMIFCADFLEHISSARADFVIDEIWRVLKPNGLFESWTPSTDGRGAFQDHDHKSFWNMNSWIYYVNTEYRELNNVKAKFEVLHMDDVATNERMKIIHTHAILKAIKEE